MTHSTIVRLERSPHKWERPQHPDMNALRTEIDRIDDTLLDLMEERLRRAADIAGLKRAADPAQLRLRPSREQEVFDRLANRAQLMSPCAVAALWRELMALSLQSQQVTRIVLHAPQQPVAVSDAARRRFGCAAPMDAADSAEEALAEARGGHAIAIIELSPLSSWWTALIEERDLSIFDGLRDQQDRIVALAVGRVAPAHLSSQTAYPILTEPALRTRIESGEAVRALAMSRQLRLCVSEGAASVAWNAR